MNWIEGIGEAINYIEANLTGELTVGEIAKKACVSPYYFQKSFALLCGFTVGEYIRRRRLAQAGSELLTTDDKVIDLALRYGYDSADSFTKAFSRFHGATPTAVRKNGRPIKTYSPLQLQLFLKGGLIMDYRIKKQEAFSVKIKIRENEIVYLDDGKLPDFVQFAINIRYREELPSYRIERVAPGEPTDGFDAVRVPGFLWAIFKCSGATRTEAREKTWEKIKSEWLPQTNYEPLSPNYIMVNYPDGEADFGEIRIAVKEKREDRAAARML